MTTSTLADRLRDGPSPTPAEVLRVARDVALGLDVLHAAGQVHGGVEPARVELLADGEARLIRTEGPRTVEREGPGARADLRDLGRLLEQALPAHADGAVAAGEDALAAEGRAVAAWLVDPGPGGATRASEAARALRKVLAGGVFSPPVARTATPSSVTPLAPHRVALRMGCQGAGVGAVAALLAALGRDVPVVVAALVGWAAAGAALTLAEELARGRQARRLPAAILFGALAPALGVLAGGVAGAAASQGQLPVAALEQLLAGVGRLRDLLGMLIPAVLLFLPCAAFAMARMRGGKAAIPAAYAGLAEAAVMLVVALVAAVAGGKAGLLLTMPFLSGVATAIVALLAGLGLLAGRGLEELLLRLAGPPP